MPHTPRWREDILRPVGDEMTVGVVADTHSKPHPAAFELLRAMAPDHVLHAGDIGCLSVLDDLARIAPLSVVRGNIDAVDGELPDFVTCRVQTDDQVLSSWLLTHIAVRGPKLRRPAYEMATRLGIQILICGHSHVPLITMDRGIAVFNPGSIGPRRFSLPITFGVIRLTRSGIAFEHIDCETGERWSPRPKKPRPA
ncbi:MAG: metallophosphoesterase family protein [Myxococcota bacterium]|nr:metallophosphoesterase family protein [Myxococcota bacterium]